MRAIEREQEVAPMVALGYKLCSEERTAAELVRDAIAAEEAGFEFAAISDHFHPWIDAQGESSFVWTVLGTDAARTSSLRVGTAVTCPIQRIHPALVAHAAATTAELFVGRFFLGLGSGENLNEHIVGGRWPSAEQRREMLLEAVAVIRELFEGALVSHEGRFFTVDRARLYTLRDELPPIYLAAAGHEAAVAAGELGDGMFGTAPDPELLEAFESNGGGGKPKIGEVTVCFAPTREAASETVRKVWPLPAIPGELPSELPLPRHFEQAAEMVDAEDLGEIPIGPDAEPYLEAIAKYVEAGYDRVTIHQVGRDQDAFMAFARSLIPQLQAA
jgi:coenzyme F420-dependent glucose-6-phosphate dehydrogenase